MLDQIASPAAFRRPQETGPFERPHVVVHALAGKTDAPGELGRRQRLPRQGKELESQRVKQRSRATRAGDALERRQRLDCHRQIVLYGKIKL